MSTRPPSTFKILTMVLFALSCAGLLLFLWLSFGGTIPFNPQGYRFEVAFPSAQQLAPQSDVRVAGVSVGTVVNTQLDPRGNRTLATIQVQNQYAPIHTTARAILREKTILGETYVDLEPGLRGTPWLRDGGMLARSQVVPAVQLDDVFNALDAPTRAAFQQWQQELSKALRGNAQNLNAVLGNLPTFAANATDILRVLDVEHAAVVRLSVNGGTVFDALSRNQTALRNLITTAHTTFATTAANNNALAATFRNFPVFLDQTKATMTRLQSFALNTDPLVRELEPVANDLGPTLASVRALAPNLKSFFYHLGPLITASKTGLPALRDVLKGATPLLGQLGPFLEQLNPILGWLSLHQQLISDFISVGASGLAAKTTSFGGGGIGHYLRQFSPIGPETLSISPTRDANNRGNTYPSPLWLANPENLVKGNFPSWDCKNTGASGDGSVTAINVPAIGRPACWVAPTLPGATAGKIPRIPAAAYPSK
ncbi:MAG TPA: MlaD family protein [Solirubrobacteraceae bacterium]|nr:MlaD family protein [Solirubrobacteraceae bacterium]